MIRFPLPLLVLLPLLLAAGPVSAQWNAENNFRLRAGDRVMLGVYRVHGDTTILMEDTLTLAGTGHVTLPNGQRVKLTNTEMRSVSALIEEGFRDRTDLAGLNVRAHLIAINGRRIASLFGEVRNPGHTTWSEGLTLADLFQRAGGVRDGGDLRRVNIWRRGEHIVLDCREPEAAEKFAIEAGDIVHIDLALLRL